MVGTGDPNSPASSSNSARPPRHVPRGADVAAQRWIDEHGDVLWRFALARTRSAQVAEEVVQETFLAALESAGDFAGQSSERTWLLGIAAHKIADHFRRVARGTHQSPASDDAPCACERCRAAFAKSGKWTRFPEAWPADVEASIDRAVQLEALHKCIEQLPPGQRELIWMRDLLDAPADEVCKQAGITPTNMWTRLHRARAALRTCMEKIFGRGGSRGS